MLESILEGVGKAIDGLAVGPRMDRFGLVREVGDGIAVCEGPQDAHAGELLSFDGGGEGIIFDLRERDVGCVLVSGSDTVHSGTRVRTTGRIADVPVGEEVIGRVVNALGIPLDGGPAIETKERLPVEREAPGIADRGPVNTPLHTGSKAVDSMIPLGRGQRELILGDRSTGKTAIAIDAILNQQGEDVVCIYVSIGQKVAATARVIQSLRDGGAMKYTVVVVADSADPPGLQYIAPYAGTSIGEHLAASGRDVLIVYDDLTKHAHVYRQISLLFRRPPGREAFPGDVFYIHSRLLERSMRLSDEKGGGSLTALPIVETKAGNISAYVPTNLISITDGQIYLDSKIFHQGQRPAIDVGRSVSRVGGKTQLPAVRAVAHSLKLEYAQFQEVEVFTKFGAQLEEATLQRIARGQRIREILKQPRLRPVRVGLLVGILMAANEGLLDDIPTDEVQLFEENLLEELPRRAGELLEELGQGQDLDEEKAGQLKAVLRDIRTLWGSEGHESTQTS